jgi:hypothetical protein
MRHLPPKAREMLERKFEQEDRMTDEERAAAKVRGVGSVLSQVSFVAGVRPDGNRQWVS